MNTILLVSLIFAMVLSGCSGDKLTGSMAKSTAPELVPCPINSLLKTPCKVSQTDVVVTDAIGDDITQLSNQSSTSTTLNVPIPDGYYSNRKILVDEPALLATNIKSGVTIMGVTGTASGIAGNCTTNGLQSSGCTAATSTFWTSIAGANITTWSNPGSSTVVSGSIPEGYYSSNTIAFTDANLVASKILNGTTIFGVTGSLNAAYAACDDDNYNAGQCSTAAPRYVSPTLGSAISSWTNASSTTTVTGSIPGGFYPTAPLAISFTDANLLAANIISGKTIFNVAGLANIFVSNVHRDKATTQITQLAEATTYAGVSLPAGYRDIPDITKDDDGYQSAGVTSPQVTLSTRPGTNCGTTQTTIAARIADCASVIGANATWDGTVKGNAGQGVWKLVTRAAASKEVWQDQRTGLIWSSVLTTGDNWCRAAGNGQTTGNGYAANDPSTLCNNVSNQPNYVNNTTAFFVQSWCAESGPVTLDPAAGSGETWGATPTYATAKGGMGMTATASSPSVRWRLPTKYDYQQADNNGIRFVMPKMATTGSGYEWSASVYANLPCLRLDIQWGKRLCHLQQPVQRLFRALYSSLSVVN